MPAEKNTKREKTRPGGNVFPWTKNHTVEKLVKSTLNQDDLKSNPSQCLLVPFTTAQFLDRHKRSLQWLEPQAGTRYLWKNSEADVLITPAPGWTLRGPCLYTG